MSRRAAFGHALVVLTSLVGIAGMGMVFDAVRNASLLELSQGTPLLLIGLWWSGRELGRSMLASKARRAEDRCNRFKTE
ncbi:MAG: hypothetical protein ACR2JC_05285 [Chloroflexota bacterium]|nr:MAG: hypothetical protein DLM70_08060 [Chloroflexota bacterium]